jgi:hypothetical protein
VTLGHLSGSGTSIRFVGLGTGAGEMSPKPESLGVQRIQYVFDDEK